MSVNSTAAIPAAIDVDTLEPDFLLQVFYRKTKRTFSDLVNDPRLAHAGKIFHEKQVSIQLQPARVVTTTEHTCKVQGESMEGRETILYTGF